MTLPIAIAYLLKWRKFITNTETAFTNVLKIYLSPANRLLNLWQKHHVISIQTFESRTNMSSNEKGGHDAQSLFKQL